MYYSTINHRLYTVLKINYYARCTCVQGSFASAPQKKSCIHPCRSTFDIVCMYICGYVFVSLIWPLPPQQGALFEYDPWWLQSLELLHVGTFHIVCMYIYWFFLSFTSPGFFIWQTIRVGPVVIRWLQSLELLGRFDIVCMYICRYVSVFHITRKFSLTSFTSIR